MPGLDGDELARRVGLVQPDLPVLLMTASHEHPAAQEGSWSAVVRKPFALDALIAAIDAAFAPATPVPAFSGRGDVRVGAADHPPRRSEEPTLP
jgi:CheY-like chemotaxis protein